MKAATFAGDFFGAFADTAILLPLIMLLAPMPGFSLPLLLASAGVTYLLAGWLFRLPMPVQPLKSIAIASISLGASSSEIRISALLLGAFFLSLVFFRVNRLPIPEPVIRSVQAGLGILLLLQAARALPSGAAPGIASLSLALVILILQFRFQVAGLGFFALAFFLFSLHHEGPAPTIADSDAPVRWPLIFSLLLPQLALTSANSISGAELTLRHYFGDRASRATSRNLMTFIGIGNLIQAAISGLPFCHGSGGVTAHVKGGARTWRMNLILGGILLILALGATRYGLGVRMGSFALPAILACVGIFHLELAKPLLRTERERLMLAVSCGITLLTSNLLYPLIVSTLFFVFFRKSDEAADPGPEEIRP